MQTKPIQQALLDDANVWGLDGGPYMVGSTLHRGVSEMANRLAAERVADAVKRYSGRRPYRYVLVAGRMVYDFLKQPSREATP